MQSAPDSRVDMLPVELTLVLAATRDMGIGLRGTLPWTGLKKEMAYFARVTKRLPPDAGATALNAVIMGRKTWDSIPPRFRPLKGRLNIVISRSFGPLAEEPVSVLTDPVKASSLEQAVAYLRGKPGPSVGRIFVIGGAQIYAAALEMRETRRILLTRVLSDFECDTHFSLPLDEARSGNAGWAKKSKGELDGWTGEAVPEGIQEENGTSYAFQMWERAD